MKICILSDSHFGARNDSQAMQVSMRKFYEHILFPTIKEQGITRVIHAGDFYDRRKYINGGTAHFVNEVYDAPMRELGVFQDILLGNHDIYYRSSTEVSLVEELYRHASDRVRVHSHPTEITIDGCDVLLLPWITDNNKQDAMRYITDSTCSVVVGHLAIAGFQMHRGLTNNEGLEASLFDRFELVMSGHYHHKSHQRPICYLGAMYPMIWSDYQDSRGFHIFDTETHGLTYIENPHSLFVKILYADAGEKHDYIKKLAQDILAPDSPYHDAYVKVFVKSKTQPYWFDVMMDCLYKVNVQDVLVIDDIIVDDADEAESTSIPDIDTLTLMREYIDTLSISCDKDELFAYLREKYHDAVAATTSARLS